MTARLGLMGQFMSVGVWFIGALFVPALALTLGVWTGTSRAFEAVYLLWWYIGPGNQVPAFDYIGVVPEGLEMGMPLLYLGITAGLLVLAMIGRRRQIQT